MNGFELTTLVVIGTDCTGSCKSNYHMLTAPVCLWYLWLDVIFSYSCSN